MLHTFVYEFCFCFIGKTHRQRHEAWLVGKALDDGWVYGQKHEAWLMGEALHDGWIYGQRYGAWLKGEALHYK